MSFIAARPAGAAGDLASIMASLATPARPAFAPPAPPAGGAVAPAAGAALAGLLNGNAGGAAAAGAAAAEAGIPRAAAGPAGSPTRAAFDYATYLRGLIESEIPVAGLRTDPRAVTGTPLDAQRAALYQNMISDANGRLILKALENCGLNNKCDVTPELTAALGRFQTSVPEPLVFQYSPQQIRQRQRSQANLNLRYPRNQAATNARTEAECKAAGGVSVFDAANNYLRCRNYGSPTGRGARSAGNRQFNQLIKFDPTMNTPQGCMSIPGATPILYRGYQPGMPIRCRSPRSASVGSPSAGGALQGIIAGARLPAYDGADEYDQYQRDMADQYDQYDKYQRDIVDMNEDVAPRMGGYGGARGMYPFV
jgi:hypothetical protein